MSLSSPCRISSTSHHSSSSSSSSQLAGKVARFGLRRSPGRSTLSRSLALATGFEP